MKNVKKEFKMLIDKYHDLEILEYFFEASKQYYHETKDKVKSQNKNQKKIKLT